PDRLHPAAPRRTRRRRARSRRAGCERDVVSFDAADAGTPERVWQQAGTRLDAAPLDIGAIRRLVVLAAHPDDETLAAGGLLHAVATTGRPVVLIVATLGEASHPHSPT